MRVKTARPLAFAGALASVIALSGGLLVAGVRAEGAETNGVTRKTHYTARTNFILRCVGCHGVDGAGTEIGGVPDYRNYVGAFSRDREGRTYLLHVPGVINSSLTDAEIADVMNYIMKTYAGSSLPAGYTPFTAEEVSALRKIPVKSVVAMRRQITARLASEGVATAGYPWP